jgi:hypothetical protein
MGWNTPDVYYQPEAFGLRTIGEVDYSDGFYQFDLVVAWQDVDTGDVYYQFDSGCSCPGIFEWATNGKEQLELVETWRDFYDAVFNKLDNESWWRGGEKERVTEQLVDLAAQVRELMEPFPVPSLSEVTGVPEA